MEQKPFALRYLVFALSVIVALCLPSAGVHASLPASISSPAQGISTRLQTYQIPDVEPIQPAAHLLGMAVTNLDGQSRTLRDGFAVNPRSQASPVITSITPNNGNNGEIVHVTNLAGSGFQPGAAVRLIKAGQADIVATNVVVLGASLIICDLDLRGADPGQWTVRVTNPDTQYAELVDGFTVKALTFLSIAVRHWPPVPYTPALNAISNPDGDGNYFVEWNAAELADTYTLQEDDNPAFSSPTTVYTGWGMSWYASGKAAGTYYYRVRASNTWGDSGWSTYRSVIVTRSIIYAAADTMIMQGYPTLNFCDTVDMWAGYDDMLDPDGKIVRSLIQFDVSGIPAGKPISKVTLYVKLYDSWDFPNRTRTITAYRVGSSWSPCSVNWNSQPSIKEAYGSRSIPWSSGEWYDFDVTELVRGWVRGSFPNHGVWLRGPEASGTDSSWRSFYTQDSAYEPYLSITYSGLSGAAQGLIFEGDAEALAPTFRVIDALEIPSPANTCQSNSAGDQKCLNALP